MLIIWSLLIPFVSGLPTHTNSGNSEVTIDRGTLKSVRQLEKSDVLNLSNLGIENIDDGAFENLKIKTLNLQKNNISDLKTVVFSRLEDLEILNLDGNRINHIDDGFRGLDNLKQLNFSDNPLNYLVAGDLLGIPRTADIFVRGNNIWSLSTRTFVKPLPEERIVPAESEEDEDEEDSEESKEQESKDERTILHSDKKEVEEAAPKPLIGEYNDALKLGKFLKDTRPSLKTAVSTKLCIEDEILKSISLFESGQELEKGCIKIDIESGNPYLNLQNRGIKRLQKGWYQLQKIPIVSLDLSKNKIDEITPDFFNDLPSDLLRVDLSGNTIRLIKKGSLNNDYIKLFNLQNNRIEDVEDGAFENTKLWGLYLPGNRIAEISFVSSLPISLTELFLNNNQILYIPDGTFLKLASLAELNLDLNGITGIQKDAFQGLSQLLTLSLSHNKIAKIETGSLASLTSLTRFYLNENLITNCEKGTFESVENLKTLHLAKNKFKAITKELFIELPRTLEILDLDDNEISSLEEQSFVGVPTEKLILSNNKIASILPAFFEINSLKHLYLKNNLINEIKENTFDGLRGLEYLWLSGNKIAELTKGSAKSLGGLTVFDISSNPIKELKNGALFGLPKNKRSNVYVANNQLELIQGGVFDDL